LGSLGADLVFLNIVVYAVELTTFARRKRVESQLVIGREGKNVTEQPEARMSSSA